MNEAASAEPLGVLALEISGADKTIVVTPNLAAFLAGWEHDGADRARRLADCEKVDGHIPNSLVVAATEIENAVTLPVPFPDVSSELSGRPALRYRTNQVTLQLAPEELLRMFARALRPSEALQLIANHGVFHEVHDDFYCPETGEAVQPMFAQEYYADLEHEDRAGTPAP